MNKKQLHKLAKKILDNESIITGQIGLGKSVQSAKAEIENIIGSLTINDFLELDEYITRNEKNLTN